MVERAGSVGGRRSAAARRVAGESTRDRILDVALDLFIKDGFDRASLREISEKLGFSKAAIYYHFASKEDILMALHMRLHEIGQRAVDELRDLTPGAESWATLLGELVGEMLANRRIFVMHDRNRSAFEALHRRKHAGMHEELNDELRRVIGDPDLSPRDRVRMACAVGAVFTTLVVYGDLLRDIPSAELEDLMGATIGDLLGVPAGTTRPAARRATTGLARPDRTRQPVAGRSRPPRRSTR